MSRAEVAPRPMPPGPALVSTKIRPTSAAPRVCPTSRAVARMPLALPAWSRGALARRGRVLGGWEEADPGAGVAQPPGDLGPRSVRFLGGHQNESQAKLGQTVPAENASRIVLVDEPSRDRRGASDRHRPRGHQEAGLDRR